MSAKIQYYPNQKINNLVYIKEAEPQASGGRLLRRAIFRCHCGNEFITLIRSVRSSGTKSCGCQPHSGNRTHGLRSHPLYTVWRAMKQRCMDKKRVNYHRYGGRGIKICSEWKDDFKSFYDWAIANNYEKGLTIDRINNDGDYEPSNCRWATLKEQANNRQRNRDLRKTDVKYPINNEGKPNKLITYCYHCGEKVRNQKFCHGCGYKLNWGSLKR